MTESSSYINKIFSEDEIRRYQTYIESVKKYGRVPSLIVPKAVQVDIINRCNVMCKFCDRWKWVNEEPCTNKILSKERIIDLLWELSVLGVSHVYFSGGEPCLREGLNEIIQWTGKLGLRGMLLTNGIVMTKEIVHLLCENNFLVVFSVSGISEDAYDKIRKIRHTRKVTYNNIKYFTEIKEKIKKGNISLNIVITKDNVEELEAILEMARKVKVDEICFNLPHGFPNLLNRISLNKLKSFYLKYSCDPLVNDRTGRLKGLADGLLSVKDIMNGKPVRCLFKKYPVTCYYLCDFSFIDTFGNVFSCCWANYHTYSYKKKRKERKQNILGNILNSNFSKIWFGKPYNNLRVDTIPIKVNNVKFTHCGDCDLYFKFKEIEQVVSDEC